MKINKDALRYLEQSFEETMELLEAICKIPAPSNHEEKRAAFCKKWLEDNGAEGVYIDDALNVVFPWNCQGKGNIVAFLAHTDTVFPDMTEPMPYTSDGQYAYSPGVGDDSICLAMMLMVAKYIIQNKLSSDRGILFVANAGEEGLGNLKGVKQIMADYDGRIERLYTFDGQYNALVNRSVGSHRYKVSFETKGGHSYGDFGNPNAICAAAELICRLSKCQVPVEGNSKSTFNVGVIEGGTSVNTIAQSASFLYEYRSDSRRCLDRMRAFFEEAVAISQEDSRVKVTVEILGIRPCDGEVDEEIFREMTENAKAICEKYSGIPCVLKSGSTDANIPMSLGVPALCVGNYLGGGMHTREEYLEIASVPVGLKITGEIILQYFYE